MRCDNVALALDLSGTSKGVRTFIFLTRSIQDLRRRLPIVSESLANKKMRGRHYMNKRGKIAIAASALAAFASIGLITNQASASNSPIIIPAITTPTLPSLMPSADVPEATNSLSEGDNVQSGDQTTPDVVGATTESDGTTSSTDGENVHSGDQTTVDVASGTDAGSND
jgi:hypothetical protein